MVIPSKNHIRLQNNLSNMLLQMGANPYHSGYRYMKECVIIVMQKHGSIKSIMKELYIPVAENNDVTYSNIERSIRHTINCMWNKTRIDVINRSFGMNIFTPLDVPTNSQLITLIAEKLSQEFLFVSDNEIVCLSESEK